MTTKNPQEPAEDREATLFLKGNARHLTDMWENHVSAKDYIACITRIIEKHNCTRIVWDGDSIKDDSYTRYFPELFEVLMAKNKDQHLQNINIKEIVAYRTGDPSHLKRNFLEKVKMPKEAPTVNTAEDRAPATTSSSAKKVKKWNKWDSEPADDDPTITKDAANVAKNEVKKTTSPATTPTVTLYQAVDVSEGDYSALGIHAISSPASYGGKEPAYNKSDDCTNNPNGHSKESESSKNDGDAIVVCFGGGPVTLQEFERGRDLNIKTRWYCMYALDGFSEINKHYSGDACGDVLKEDWKFGGKVYEW